MPSNHVGGTLVEVNIPQATAEDIPMRKRRPRSENVTVSDEQNAVLEALYERATHPSKQYILLASQETGFSEKWIRLWLQRKRRAVKRRNPSILLTSSTSTDTVSTSAYSTQSEPLNATHAFTLSRPVVWNHLYEEQTSQSSLFAHSTSLNEETLLSQAASEPMPPLQIIPYSAPTTFPSTLSLPSVMDDISNSCMRAYTRSPSLGYIPVAFPFDISTLNKGSTSRTSISTTSSSTSSSIRATNHAKVNHSAENRVPSVPQLNLNATFGPHTSLPESVGNRSTDNTNTAYKSKSTSLYDLLHSTDDDFPLDPPPLPVLPNPRTTHPAAVTQIHSQTCSTLAYPSSRINMSFEPSFQTHSTSVVAPGAPSLAPTSRTGPSQSHPFGYPPASQNSVAFKINLYELAAMAKRVKVMSGPEAISARSILSTRETSEPPETGSPASLATGDQYSAPADCARPRDMSSAISNNNDPELGIDGHETDDESQEAITPHLSRDEIHEDLAEPDDLSYVTMHEKTNELSYSDFDDCDENAL
ncbi:hypothetical protein QCA50_006933 [Cerrena zonata]|uniref:Homeobox domain-containing protein n=1 Tax=Cerrena zonata TaxID=2478898 RepID=A0AAW0G9F6_9APHY